MARKSITAVTAEANAAIRDCLAENSDLTDDDVAYEVGHALAAAYNLSSMATADLMARLGF
jgi:hypothetical protein